MAVLLTFVALLGGAATTLFLWSDGWVLALGLAPLGGSVLAAIVAAILGTSNRLQRLSLLRSERRLEQ
jgi:hypothetical protein